MIRRQGSARRGGRPRRRWWPLRRAAAAPPAPLDPQNWSFQDNLTWADYKPMPGPGLHGPEHPADRQEVARRADHGRLSRPAVHGHAAGRRNDLRHAVGRRAGIPREQVPQFYADFLNKPSALNNFQTMNRYWMEDSFGKLRRGGRARTARTGCRCESYQYHIGNFQNVDRGLPETRATRDRIRRPAARTTSPPPATPGAANVTADRARDVRQQF